MRLCGASHSRWRSSFSLSGDTLKRELRWRAQRPNPESGSLLIIVLWIAFGLVALTLYFAHSMNLELRASDNRVAAVEAGQAIDGAARYLSNILTTVAY